MQGMTGENLMVMLESRLDSVVFRMGFARTRREARQIVDHQLLRPSRWRTLEPQARTPLRSI